MAKPATKTAPKSKKLETTRIDIDHNSRARVAEMLNQLLADSTDMHLRTKHAHWNVKGPHFIGLHKYFDELYDAIGGHIDEIAERTAAVGGFVKGRLSDAAGASRLKEFPAATQDGLEVVRALADALADVSNAIRDGIDTAEELDDMVTSDMLTGISGDLDKHLWFLEAHLR
jgi:starvation-inducible DNA-binding protein